MALWQHLFASKVLPCQVQALSLWGRTCSEQWGKKQLRHILVTGRRNTSSFCEALLRLSLFKRAEILKSSSWLQPLMLIVMWFERSPCLGLCMPYHGILFMSAVKLRMEKMSLLSFHPGLPSLELRLWVSVVADLGEACNPEGCDYCHHTCSIWPLGFWGHEHPPKNRGQDGSPWVWTGLLNKDFWT